MLSAILKGFPVPILSRCTERLRSGNPISWLFCSHFKASFVPNHAKGLHRWNDLQEVKSNAIVLWKEREPGTSETTNVHCALPEISRVWFQMVKDSNSFQFYQRFTCVIPLNTVCEISPAWFSEDSVTKATAFRVGYHCVKCAANR